MPPAPPRSAPAQARARPGGAVPERLVSPLRPDVPLTRHDTPPYRLAIFDFDGTLADSFPAFLAGFNDAAERFGFRGLDERDVAELRGKTSWQIMEHMEIAMWQVPMITQFVRNHMAEHRDRIGLFPGTDAMLETLASAGVVLAVVSSNSESSIRAVLGERLASLVAHYRCNASIFGKRPKLRQVLAAARVEPADAIAIGDEIRDMKAARAEGIPFGAVAWGFAAPAALEAEGPEHLFHGIAEIAGVLAPFGVSVPPDALPGATAAPRR